MRQRMNVTLTMLSVAYEICASETSAQEYLHVRNVTSLNVKAALAI